MNAVDTGWINDEKPMPLAKKHAEEQDFQTPLDEIDAAARVVDPILSGVQWGMRGGSDGGDGSGGDGSEGHEESSGSSSSSSSSSSGDGRVWGKFLKDYVSSEW